MSNDNKIKVRREPETIGSDFFDRLWEQSWTYIKTVVDVVHEPVLILDKELCVMAANEAFYKMFQVSAENTEGEIVYNLGNGQWDIPELRKLLEDILPKDTFFKGFQVSHEFPTIGHKTMILNGRRIHTNGERGAGIFPPIILLAMEDITEMMAVAESFATHTNKLEDELSKRTKKMEVHIEELESQINQLKNKSKK